MIKIDIKQFEQNLKILEDKIKGQAILDIHKTGDKISEWIKMSSYDEIDPFVEYNDNGVRVVVNKPNDMKLIEQHRIGERVWDVLPGLIRDSFGGRG